MSDLLPWTGPDVGFDAEVLFPLHPKVCWLPILSDYRVLLSKKFLKEKLKCDSIDPMIYWSFLVYDVEQRTNSVSYLKQRKTETAISSFSITFIEEKTLTKKLTLSPFHHHFSTELRSVLKRPLGDSSNFRKHTWNFLAANHYPWLRWITDLRKTLLYHGVEQAAVTYCCLNDQ